MNAHPTGLKVHRLWENEQPTLKRAARDGVLRGELGFHEGEEVGKFYGEEDGRPHFPNFSTAYKPWIKYSF